jgi:hypothetical protein
MKTRLDRIMPKGQPKWVRCYDNGGETADRYTVVFVGRYRKSNQGFHYVGMSADPFWGIGQHGETAGRPCDVNEHGYAPAIGRKCHIGKRIQFSELPEKCQWLVAGDYKELWGIQ